MPFLFFLSLLLSVTSLHAQVSSPADLLLINGKIITVDAAFSVRTAMAVKGERIAAVGSARDLEAYRGPSTRVIDLQGRTVMPGLMDSHSHGASACLTEFDHPIPDMTKIRDVLDYVQSRAELLKDGEWIWVSQVFITRLEEQRYPTRKELDAVAPRNPVVFRTGPDASLNSLALKLSGIDEHWEVDDGGPGYAEKDPETGELTGVLRSCTRYIKHRPSTREPSPEEHEKRLKELIADYNRVGITSIAERSSGASDVKLYERLQERGELNVRAYISRRVDANKPIDEIELEIRAVQHGPSFEGTPLVRARAIKVFLDGGMLTGSAYMRKPWGTSKIYGITDPDYKGLLFIPEDKLRRMMMACMELDVQFTAHSQGDGAVHAFIDASESLSGRFDLREKRPVICHGSFMSEEAVERAARLGVGLDIQPAWLYLDARTLLDHFGYERLAWFQPLRQLFALGAIVGGGSDHMQKIGARRSINFYDPWMGMWVAMTRQANRVDRAVHPEHALSRTQAIRFYTINNAYLTFQERQIGSLEPGKLADFIVLPEDPLTCPLEKFKDLRPVQTYLGGKLVYEM